MPQAGGEEYTKALAEAELNGNPLKKVVVKGREIVICKHPDGIFAMTAVCPHAGGPLEEGDLTEDFITCPWHGWSFNIKDGSYCMNPRIKLPCYPVKTEGGWIYIKV